VSSFVETKKYIPQGRPLLPEILVQTDLPLLIAASLDTFCLVAPQRQELAKKSSVMTNMQCTDIR